MAKKKKTKKKRAKKKARKRKPKEEIEEFDPLVRQMLADSPLKSAATATFLGAQLDTLLRQTRALRKKQRRGPLRADEARTIPALASNAKRLCDTLGTTVQTDPDEDGEL